MVLVMISASLSGCLGGDDSSTEEYSGPIDLVVYYDTTSGVVETSSNNGQAGPTTGVELSFDFASTDSNDGDIEKIWIMPDDGSDTIEQDPADNAILTYTWLTHGVFSAMLGATDSAGNEHSIVVKVKIDMHIVWTDSNTASASMNFDATPDCEDGDPLPDRITFDSSAENTGGNPFIGGGSSEVSWSLNDPGGNETASQSGTIGDGQTETWSYTTRAVVEGVWSLNVEVTQGDNVNVNNDVTIAYAEGAESATNPRPQ
ncbi:MAG: hypothetical protein QGI21_01800 [Candidatus Poseidoniaceae archaeon]|jgi:hypothetical protein|nr:hypothetical protein [Candidatus Poseidoniaceae archaeon]